MMADKAKKGRLDSAVMFPLMELFEESGMTQRQFCEDKDIVQHTFTYWLGKYRRVKRGKDLKGGGDKFIGLSIAEPERSAKSVRLMRISYADGTIVELPV